MDLLVDNDVAIKLHFAGLLEPTLQLFAGTLGRIGWLPSARQLVRKKQNLRPPLSAAERQSLVDIICQGERVFESTLSLEWQAALISGLDSGEAILFAAAAENGVPVLTGDKTAVAAVRQHPHIAGVLQGRIALFETAVVELLERNPLLSRDSATLERLCLSDPALARVLRRNVLRAEADRLRSEFGDLLWRSSRS